MKTKFLSAVLVLVLGTWFSVSAAMAKPERLAIKKAEHRVKEKNARSRIKNIDLRNIKDPEARKAIREILHYMNLQAKN